MPGQGVEYSLQHPSATQLLCMVTCSPPPAKVKESLRPFGFESVSFRGQVALPSRVKDPCGFRFGLGVFCLGACVVLAAIFSPCRCTTGRVPILVGVGLALALFNARFPVSARVFESKIPRRYQDQ